MIWLQRALDGLLPGFVAWAWLVQYDTVNSMLWAGWAFVFGVMFVAVAQLQGVYRQWLKRSAWTIIGLTLQAAVLSLVLTVLLGVAWGDGFHAPVMILAEWWSAFLALSVGYRLLTYAAMKAFRRRCGQQRKVAVCGTSKVGQALASKLMASPETGYQVVGFFDDSPLPKELRDQGYAYLGSLSAVMEPSLHSRFDEVFICLPVGSEWKIRGLMDALADSTKVVKFVPDLFAFDLMHSHFVDLKGFPVFSVFDSPLTSLTAKLLKRGIDLLVSLVILGMLSPVMAAIAILIRSTSKGPVLFKQVRYGLDGCEMKVYKFRSMSVMENGDEVQQARAKDPRVTKIGRFLRRTSLDELPQFYNVLQGRMSVVGPRPHAKAHNELYRKLVPKYMQRHLVKPGITGWAQVNGWRGETDTVDKMQKRVEFDLHYIKNWSVWLDLKIMVMTLFSLKSQC